VHTRSNQYRRSARPSAEAFAFRPKASRYLFMALHVIAGCIFFALILISVQVWFMTAVAAVATLVICFSGQRRGWKTLTIDQDRVTLTSEDGKLHSAPLHDVDAIVHLSEGEESIELVQLGATFRRTDLDNPADFRRIVWRLVDGASAEDASSVLELVGARAAAA
jgi:hypothetical protein